jgi:hypothetical protein
MYMRLVALSVVFALLCAGPVFSHHGSSEYQMDQVQTLTGLVKEWKWSYPHTWLTLVVDDKNGAKVEWALEGGAPGALMRAGWERTKLKPGEKVTVHMSPAKDGSHVGRIAHITKEDGTILSNGGL